ncbi:hypothetical protein Tco_1025022 [Tanacetum coccineum]
MSTLLELSAIANSNNLKDMMILLFESENQKYLITTDNMNMIAENLSIRVSEREILIGKLDHCPCTMAYDSGKLLREMNDSDLAKIRCLMASVSHIQIKDEEYFSQLCDEYAIRVCLLLCLEVIFMDKLMVKEVDDTLMRLVKSLEAWNAFPWGEHIWMQLYDEIMNVVDNHKSEHLEGLHKSRKYVPTVGTQSGDDTEEECHETEDFLLEEKFMRRLLEEERLLLEEERLFEEEKRVRLEDQKRLNLEQECELQVKKRWDEDYRKRKFDKKNKCFGVVDRDMTEFLKTVKPWVKDLSRIHNAIDHIWISEDLDLYLGKSGRL